MSKAELTDESKPKDTTSFRENLRNERRQEPIRFLTMLIALASFIVTSAALVFVSVQASNVKKQIRALNASLDLQSYSAINTQLAEIDNLFIDHPDLRPYFFEGAPWPSEEKPENLTLRRKLTSVAEKKLDFIDFWFMSARHLDLQRSDMVSWRNYFLGSFQNSPILCDVLKDEKEAYGEEVLSIAHKSGCPIKPRRVESLRVIDDYFRPQAK